MVTIQYNTMNITKVKKNITTKKWTSLLTQPNNNGIIPYVLKIIMAISQRKGNYFDLSL